MDDRRWLAHAVELGRRCPPSTTAFAVGSVIVGGGHDGGDPRDRDARGGGTALAEGYSRAEETHDHAEEVALRRLARQYPVRDLADATLYSSLEPCSARASRPRTCTELIIAAGIRRVVFAWREPAVFVDCRGAELLAESGTEVIEIPEMADQVRGVNAHLFDAS